MIIISSLFLVNMSSQALEKRMKMRYLPIVAYPKSTPVLKDITANICTKFIIEF